MMNRRYECFGLLLLDFEACCCLILKRFGAQIDFFWKCNWSFLAKHSKF